MSSGVPSVAAVDEAEVVVVGAGPAGATCAAILAERGHDVLLVDQNDFPRDKPCGDGLTRSAVLALERLGLSDVLERGMAIEGLRMVFDWRRREYSPYGPRQGRTVHARCVRRAELDLALRDLAVARGARFMRARCTGTALDGDRVNGIRVTVGGADRPGGADRRVAASLVIAADGATSRLGRESGRRRDADRISAYAVRRYMRTEKPLDSVFDVFVPIEHDDRTAVGYGWVFPIEEHVANLGIGYWTGAGLSAPTRLREALATFTDSMQVRMRDQFGDLEPITKPFGSPLGMNFASDRCDVGRLLFVGDAARTTDPFTGEGIAYALAGAEAIAQVATRMLQGRPTPSAGTTLARRFPRLGQEVGLPARLAERRMHDLSNVSDGSRSHEFVSGVHRIVTTAEEDLSLVGSALGGGLRRHGGDVAWLEALDAVILDQLGGDFPFARELLFRHVLAGVGPLCAAVTVMCADGGDGDLALASGAAIEIARHGLRSAARMTDRPRGNHGKLNNLLAILTADQAMARALLMSAEIDAAFVDGLAAACGAAAEASMEASALRYDTTVSPGHRLELAAAESRAFLELAARRGAGARAGGGAAASGPALRDVAGAIAELEALVADAVATFLPDDHLGAEAGDCLRFGVLTWPVLAAVQESDSLRRLLGRGVVDDADVAEVLDRVRATRAAERALDTVHEHAARARRSIDDLGVAPGLAALVDGLADHAAYALASAGERAVA